MFFTYHSVPQRGGSAVCVLTLRKVIYLFFFNSKMNSFWCTCVATWINDTTYYRKNAYQNKYCLQYIFGLAECKTPNKANVNILNKLVN